MRFIRTFPVLALFAAVSGLAFAADPKDAPPVLELPPNEVIEKVLTANELKDQQDWGIASMNVPAAWKTSKGKGTVIAVLDTGAMSKHRDLTGQVIKGKDFSGSPYGWEDKNGHGTHCLTTIIAAENDWGMTGVAPEAKGLVVKVLSDGGSGGVDRIAAGIDYAVTEGADVINMSLGGPGRDAYIPPAIKRAIAAGVIVIAAAGNEGPREGTVGFPGGYEGVICVAAHDSSNAVAGFSSRGAAVFVCAPGVNVRAGIPGPGDGLFGSMSGTSMATPQVAGLALNWVAGPGKAIAKKDRPAAFEKALKACCSKAAGPRSTAYGWGRPDAAKLVGDPGNAPMPPPVSVVRLTAADLATVEGLRKGLGLLLGGQVEEVTFTIKP